MRNGGSRRRGLALGLGAAMVGPAVAVGNGSASAQAPPVELEWEAAVGCPEGDEVRARVAELLGGPDVVERPGAEAAVRARAVVTKRGADWALSLVTEQDGEEGERTLEGPSCEAIAEAAALVLALMIDPEAGPQRLPDEPVAEETPTPGEPAVAREAAPEPVAGAPTPEDGAGLAVAPRARGPGSSEPRPQGRPPRRNSPRTSWFLALRAAGDVGTLPDPAAGAAVALGLERGALRLEVGGRVLGPRSEGLGVDGPAGAGGELLLGAAGLRACGRFGRGRLTGGPCGALEVGALRGRGFGVSDPSAGRSAWAAVRAGADARVATTSWLAFSAAVDLVVPFTRPRFVLEGLGPVHRPAPVSGRLDLGVEVRFP